MTEINQFLNQIYGHSKAKDLLSGFLASGKIPHALLFSGIDGIGKDHLAIRFAQAINSNGIKDSASLKIITSKINNLEEPFIKYIIPLPRAKNETNETGPTEKFSEDEIELLREELQKKINNPYYKFILPKANNIKISSIRDINKFLSFDFSELKFRVIIISDAHLMNEQAQNALLKNLEEPPVNVIFILTTSQPSMLRETILSRCWRINLEPLSDENLIAVLTEHFTMDNKLAETIAPFAGGSTQTAIRLSEMDFNNMREKTISILRYSFGMKFHSAFEVLNTILADEPAQNLQVIIKMIMTWINDLNRFRHNVNTFFYKDHLDTLQKFHQKFPDRELNDLTFQLDNLSTLLKKNIHINLLTSNLVFELSNIITAKSA